MITESKVSDFCIAYDSREEIEAEMNLSLTR